MENQKEKQQEEIFRQCEKSHKRGKVVGGILLVTVGSLLMARELGAEIPHWVFSWKTFLIGLGIMVGFKHGFKYNSWIILILIGLSFTIADIYPELSIRPLLWPFLIILFGLFIIFKPRRKRDYYNNRFRHRRHWREWQQEEKYKNYFSEVDSATSTSTNEIIDSVTFMGGIKKKIISKNFKGGDVTVIFGGAELDFIQADLNENVVLEITQIFGGTKLIVPAHWEIKSELVSIFGSIEDKRPTLPKAVGNEPAKILILKGTTIFGGIDIKSF